MDVNAGDRPAIPPDHESSWSDGYIILLERLAALRGIDPDSAGTGLSEHARHETPGTWDSTWQDRLERSVPTLGYRARSSWLSPAEVAGALSPGNPMVSFRRTQRNPRGWTLLLDRRGGRVLRANLDSRGSSDWIDIRELAEDLEVRDDERSSWILCDPMAPVDPAAEPAHHTGDAPSARQRLVQLIRPDRADLGSIVAFGVVVGALTLATPLAVQQLVSSVALGGLLQPLVVLSLLLLASLGFSAALTALQAFVAEVVQRRIFVRVVGDLAYRLPRVRLDAFDRQEGPELVNRFFDVMTVQKVGSILVLDGVALALQTLIGLLVLSFYHPLMLAFSVVLLAGIVFVGIVLGRGAVSTAILESKAKYVVQAWLEEISRRSTELKTPGAARFARDQADGLARKYLRARAAHYKIVLRQYIGALGLQVVASSTLLGLGGGLVIVGQLTLGQLVASELIVTAIVASFAKLGKHLESFYDLLAAADKVGTLLELPLERDDGHTPDDQDGGLAIALHDVSFHYEDHKAIDGLEFTIQPGEHVAIAGPSGVGKTTLFDLLLGLRTPSHGYITLDGVDLRELRLEGVRDQIVRIRGPEIIRGTIEQNVVMGRVAVDRTRVQDALEAVGLRDEVRLLPDGIQTQLTSDGRPLAHGAAMRLTMARAIAGKPRLILLDDTLADLDQASREQAMKALLSRDASWTVLMSAPDVDSDPRCDRTIHLRPTEGAIADRPREDSLGGKATA